MTEDQEEVKTGENNGNLPPLQLVPKEMESIEEKISYPKSVFFIVTNEFCERFSFYGMRAVLTLYLTNALNFSETTSTVIYHGFVSVAYFTPLLGAMLADAVLGKFKTIFYLSIVYAIGSIVLSLAATPNLGLPAVEISMLGLALIALGTGGIKPCVSAFGGDQFILPQQAVQLATFFSFFYMSINAGALLSTLITPIIREDVQCFGEDSCYTLAFGIPAALMIVSIVIFVSGKFLYRETKPTGNVVVKMVKCISHAISRKYKSKDDRSHWLDHADDTYEQRFIEDVKIVLRVLLLYIPLPIFWTLYDQQGSRWTLQANRMDGVVGSYTIKPDQVQVLSALLILIFVPLFDYIIYPLLAKCHLLTKPLQRLTAGGVLAGLSFIVSGLLEVQLENTNPIRLASTEVNLNFINSLPCSLNLAMEERDEIPILSGESFVFEKVPAGVYNLHNGTQLDNSTGIRLTYGEPCASTFSLPEPIEFLGQKTLDDEDASEGGSFTYMITFDNVNVIQLAYGQRSDDREKPQKGDPKLRILVGGDYFLENSVVPQGQLSVHVTSDDDTYDFLINRNNSGDNVGFASESQTLEPVPHKIKLIYGGTDDKATVELEFQQEFDLKLGGSYLITISRNEAFDVTTIDFLDDFNLTSSYKLGLNAIAKPSSIHMFWLLPQYIVITAGEIMFSITGLEFSYSQSPVSMKSVMQSAWLMTVAFGNLIVMIISEAQFFEEQSNEAFLYAGLMFVDMIIFAFMAYRYVPAQLEDPSGKQLVSDEDDA